MAAADELAGGEGAESVGGAGYEDAGHDGVLVFKFVFGWMMDDVIGSDWT